MSAELRGPGDRYTVMVEAAATYEEEPPARHRERRGEPFWDVSGGGGARREAGDAGYPHSYMVVVGDACSLALALGENGLTVRSVKLLRANRVEVTAHVSAEAGAPEWLPTASTYRLFEGDREDAFRFRERFIPFAGLTDERAAPEPAAAAPLDKLAVAVGRSIARANAVLARSRADAGVALVSSVTIRVALAQTDLGQGRVFVTLARPESGQTGQFLELTMSTVPAAEPEEEPEEKATKAEPDPQPSATVIRTRTRGLR